MGSMTGTPEQGHGRYVSFENLIKTDRCVKVVSRERISEFGSKRRYVFVVVRFAGEQNEDGSNRQFAAGFADQKSAREAARSLRTVIREGYYHRVINTDHQYNKLLTCWAEAVKSKIEQRNSTLLEEAERKAMEADPESALIDVRGMSLGDWLRTIFGIKRKKSN